MSKVLLMSGPFSAQVVKVGPVTEYLGLCYLSGYLKYNGVETEVFDSNATDVSWEDFLAKLDLDSYILIGFSIFTTNYDITKKIVQTIRERGYKGHITAGGHYPSFNWQSILSRNEGIDSVIVGEGEVPLFDLVKSLENGEDWQKVNGLVCRTPDGIKLNPQANLLESLDFPFFPDRTFYQDKLTACNFSTLSSSRGCWGSCNFCSIRNFYKLAKGPNWRFRSPKNVVDEMEDINRRLGITSFAFVDDNFIGTGDRGKNRARAIAQELADRNLGIVYSLECRPDDVEEELFAFLKQTGLVKVSIGIESFVPRQQQLYNKTLSNESIFRAVNTLKKLELLMSLYIIMFDPWVTFDDFLTNFKYVNEIGAMYFSGFTSFLQVFAGTPLFTRFKEEKLLQDHIMLQTDKNVYWLNYYFEDPRIEHILKMWLYFDEQVRFLLPRYLRKLPDEKAYEALTKVRSLTYECYLTSIVQGKEIFSYDGLFEFLNYLVVVWLGKCKKALDEYVK